MTKTIRALEKLPFLVELFINGSFILVYSLLKADKVPTSWNMDFVSGFLNLSTWIVPMVIFFVLIGHYITCSRVDEFIRRYVFSIIVFVPLIITWGDIEFTYWLGSAHLLSSALSLYDSNTPAYQEESGQVGVRELLLTLKPAQIVLVTFIGIILIGTFLLMLPISSKGENVIEFVDALFMATSATCVTGLVTLGLQENFTLFGQIVLLILIQVGGLGYMTLASSITILLGKATGMKERLVMQDLLDVSSQEELIDMIVDIIKYTFIIELWGAVVLTIAFLFEDFDFGTSIYYGFFHSISAFCNAGFTIFPDSLESFSNKPMVHGTISILIILGGLGFIVLKELKTVFTTEKKIMDLGLHSKIVIVVNLILLFMGGFIIFFSEFLGAFDTFTLWEKIQAAAFQSVTLRTAGFNTVPLTNLETHTIYFMTLFMFIGASPGSTGGGIKTSTLAILFQSIRATLRGRPRVEFFDRTIPNVLVVRATALSIISVIVTTSFIFIMSMVENDQTFFSVFFEVVSASGTVGLSLGITPYLTVAGKFLISLLMLVGRVGPLTLVLAIGDRNQKSGKFEYPEGRLLIG